MRASLLLQVRVGRLLQFSRLGLRCCIVPTEFAKCDRAGAIPYNFVASGVSPVGQSCDSKA